MSVESRDSETSVHQLQFGTHRSELRVSHASDLLSQAAVLLGLQTNQTPETRDFIRRRFEFRLLLLMFTHKDSLLFVVSPTPPLPS